MGISDQRAIGASIGAVVGRLGLVIPSIASAPPTPPAGFTFLWQDSGSKALKITKPSGETVDLENVATHGSSYYGDGSDGAVTLDGAITPAFATRSGSTYTLTRDVLCTTLTVNAGVTVKTTQYVIRCSVALVNAGTIHGDGNAGAGTAAGGAQSAANILSSLGAGGGAGRSTAGAGSAGNTTNTSFGGSGGNGGAGGAGAGGAGASATAPTGAVGSIRSTVYLTTHRLINGTTVTQVQGGAGGGGGGCAPNTGTASSGGGGGGGIAVFIACKALNNTGTIRSNGGDGAAGVATGDGVAGGGGGGGGGYVVLLYDDLTALGTVTANGGTGGAGAGGGAAGASGTVGTVLTFAA